MSDSTLPSYTLAPEARISHITGQIGAAITLAASQVPGSLRLSGHSAVGHLVSRMICDDTPLAAEVLQRVDHTLSISGLHDLRPLTWTKMNNTLHLDDEEAAGESAALHRPSGNPRLTTWVGGGERPEFIRQTQIMSQIWDGLDAETRCVVDGSHNHFTVIEALRDKDSALTDAFVRQQSIVWTTAAGMLHNSVQHIGSRKMGELGRRSPDSVSVHQTRDPALARHLLCDRFKPHVMRCISRKAFEFAHMSAAVPEGTFNILRYGAAVEIEPEPFEDFFMLEMPIASGVDIESQGRASLHSCPDTALFLPPHVRFASTWRDGCVQLMLKVRNAEVLRRWQGVVGDPEAQLPRVHPEIDLKTPEGWRVQQMMGLLRQEFEQSVQSKTDRLSSSPLAGAAIDAVMAYYRDRPDVGGLNDSYRILPAQLRVCVNYIERNLAGDLSISHLLAQTEISERSLFNLFQQFLGTTPKGYVQQQRLRRSRSLLVSGDLSVTEAARQAGFTHMGRFSGLYRKHYGENPSSTRA